MISNLTYGTYARGGGAIITADNLIPVALDAWIIITAGDMQSGRNIRVSRSMLSPRKIAACVSKDIVEVTLSYESFLMSYAKMSFNGGVEALNVTGMGQNNVIV